MKGRFAPSPTGRMHLGNVYAALLSWLSVKSKGGQWLLRIEDIDPQRSRQEYADQLMRDLEWLGLEWDEGPFYQSQRGDFYAECLSKLRQQGVTYPCYCTRRDILATQAPHESDGRVVYKGTCRNLKTAPEGRTPSVRIIVPDEDVSFVDHHYGPQKVNLASHCGDFILQRSDGAWAYQLAVVADDADMGITEIVRGRDLLLSAPQQLFLFHKLNIREGAEQPMFSHVPLLLNASGQRLSKRDGSLDLGVLSDKFTPEEIIGHIAYMTKIIDRFEPISASQLINRFSWDKIPLDDIVIKETDVIKKR